MERVIRLPIIVGVDQAEGFLEQFRSRQALTTNPPTSHNEQKGEQKFVAYELTLAPIGCSYRRCPNSNRLMEVAVRCNRCKEAIYCCRKCRIRHRKVHKHNCNKHASQPTTTQATAAFKGQGRAAGNGVIATSSEGEMSDTVSTARFSSFSVTELLNNSMDDCGAMSPFSRKE